MDVSGHIHDPATFPQMKQPPIPIGQELWWASGPSCTKWQWQESLPLLRM